MAAIKPIDQSASKWQRRASVAGEDYTQGVTNPRTQWQTASAAADATYRQAVTTAAQAGRYAAGIQKAGNAKWQANAIKKGPGRFTEGVTLAVDEWQKGFGPIQAAFSALQPPPRGVTGSPANLQRVAAFNAAARRAAGRG